MKPESRILDASSVPLRSWLEGQHLGLLVTPRSVLDAKRHPDERTHFHDDQAFNLWTPEVRGEIGDWGWSTSDWRRKPGG